MNAKRNLIQICLLCAAMLPAATGLIALAIFGLVQSAGAQQYGDYDYTYNGDGTITITGYTGSGGAISIPAMINGTNVTSIGYGAFNEINNNFNELTSVVIPNSITSIGGDAFYSCDSLTNITIPTNVTNIGVGAFAYCVNLATITVDAQNSFYSSTNGVLLNKNQTTLVQFPENQGVSYTI